MQSILPQDLLFNIFGDGSEYLWAFDAQEEEEEEVQHHEKKRIDNSLNIEDALLEVTSLFFFPISELEESLKDNSRKYSIPPDPNRSFAVASTQWNYSGNLERDVIKMLIQQISSSPVIRDLFCSEIASETRLSVHPTDMGMRQIDPLHEFYPIKYLKSKPLSAFIEDQIVLVMSAVEQNLLFIEWHFDADKIKEFWRGEFFCGTEIGSEWNSIRFKISDGAIDKLLEYSKQYFMETMNGKAITYITDKCCESLLKMADYKCPIPLKEEDFVLSLSHDDKDIIGAITTRDGFLVDSFTIRLTDFSFKSDRTEKTLRSYTTNQVVNNNKKTLVDLREDYNICAVICGGQGPKCKDILELALMFNQCHVVMVGDYFARIKRYLEVEENVFITPELPKNVKEEIEYSENERYLTSLARYFINPTLEIGSLFNKSKDYLLLPFHSFQHKVPEDLLFSALLTTMKDIVIKCGLDLNYVLHRPHLHSSVQFIKGLHQTRVEPLIQSLLTSPDQVIYSRTDLYNEEQQDNYLSAEEFLAIAEIIRVGDSEIEFADPLDDTRIHPEFYPLARKICSDALEETEQELDVDNPSKSVIKLYKDPKGKDKLRQLELGQFAEHISSMMDKTVPESKELVNHIRDQLILQYQDTRKSLYDHHNHMDEMFFYCTGETDSTLDVNMHFNGEIRSISEKHVFVTLECGLQGKLDAEDISLIDRNAFDLLKPQMPIRCSIKFVNKELFQIQLDAKLTVRQGSDRVESGASGRDSKLMHYNEVSVRLDGYFDLEKCHLDDEKLKKQQEKAQSNIRHAKSQYFKNIDFKNACKYLRQIKNPKIYYVFRPSRNGDNYLNITWKIDKDLFGNLEIQQDFNNSNWTLSNDPSKSFKQEEEVVHHYIANIQMNVTQILKHAKFVQKNEQQVRAQLDKLSKKGKTVPYLLHFDYSKPLMCMISYKATPDSSVQHVSFKINYDGYSMQQFTYKRVISVINDFKRAVSGQQMLGDV